MHILIKVSISIGSLIALILLAQSQFIHDSLFKRSLTLIPELQKDLTEDTIMPWVHTSDIIVYVTTITPLALTYIILQERPRCIYFFFIRFGMEYVYKNIKLGLH